MEASTGIEGKSINRSITMVCVGRILRFIRLVSSRPRSLAAREAQGMVRTELRRAGYLEGYRPHHPPLAFVSLIEWLQLNCDRRPYQAYQHGE